METYNLIELLNEAKKNSPVTNEDRVKYTKEYVDHYGKREFPSSALYSSLKSQYKNPYTWIVETKDFKIMLSNNSKTGAIVASFPIFYNDDVVIDILKQMDYCIITETYLDKIPFKSNWYEDNYYSDVNENWENYNTNSWRNSRRVDLNDTKITFREITEKDKEYITLIHENWKNKFPGKVYYNNYYKSIINENRAEAIQYKGTVTCYRNIPVIFRYYWEYANCNTVDFENGINGKNIDVSSNYMKKAISEILAIRKQEVSVELVRILAKKEKLNKDRELYKNRKEWKKVKKIDKELSEIQNEIDRLKHWKTDEINSFCKFIKNSCQNYNRYKYIEYLKNRGIEYYFEDGIGYQSNSLKTYKEEKNGYKISAYMVTILKNK